MHYVIVDVETTGGSPKQSKITEIHELHNSNDSCEQLILALLTLDECLFRDTLGGLIK